MDSVWDVAFYAIENHPLVTVFCEILLLLFVRQIVISLPFKPSATFVGKSNPQVMKAKFGESLWFFIYYSCTFLSGIVYLWDSPWLWETQHYWIDAGKVIPPFPASLKLIYSTQLSFYISASIVVLFLSHARANHKDKLIMLLHHIVTIILIGVSYWFGQHRIGSMVMILHDVSDIFLEGAKISRYLGFMNLTNGIFVVFAMVFFVSRLILLPLRVLAPIATQFNRNFHYSVTQCEIDTGICISTPLFTFPVTVFWLILLGTLQCLHIYWFALIMRMVLRAIVVKTVEKDIRSDDEEELDSSPQTSRKNSKIKTN